jgi:hypothetical protein
MRATGEQSRRREKQAKVLYAGSFHDVVFGSQ